MCGILGVISTRGPVDGAAVARLRDRLAHRGPDGKGLYVSRDGSAALAHRRLSIIDLSDLARQPMCNEDGTLWVTYNGEIYNFRELRADLECKGHIFRTNSDTEVILHGYEEWGDRCVEQFRGMFAFGVWDETRRRLFLARDRVGIKPLFYYWDGRTFLFASELKALTGYEGVDTAPDLTALSDYLTYLYIPAPKTAYKRIRKVLPAHILVFDRGRTTESPYWDLRSFGSLAISEEDAQGLLREKLEETVRSHMMSDVPVGSLLSGGLDSSTVTAFASNGGGGPLRTFCVGFDAKKYSETEFARLLAGSCGTRHRESVVGAAAVRDQLSEIVGLYDEPYADSSAIPTREVCRVAREDVKVALSGDGGDEVFVGYPRYSSLFRRANWLRIPGLLRRPLFSPVSRLWPRHWRAAGAMVDLAAASLLDLYAHTVEIFTPSEKRGLLGSDIRHELNGYDDYWYYREYWRGDLDLVTCLQYLDFKTYLPDDILTKVDRASMAVSLEVRPPFLDHALVEFVFSVPTAQRFAGGELKPFLKRAMRGHLPAEILSRGKKGFSVPWKDWMRTERAWAEQVLLEGVCSQGGVFDRKRLKSWLSPHSGGTRVWTLLVLNEWFAQHGSGAGKGKAFAAPYMD